MQELCVEGFRCEESCLNRFSVLEIAKNCDARARIHDTARNSTRSRVANPRPNKQKHKQSIRMHTDMHFSRGSSSWRKELFFPSSELHLLETKLLQCSYHRNPSPDGRIVCPQAFMEKGTDARDIFFRVRLNDAYPRDVVLSGGQLRPKPLETQVFPPAA